VRTSPLLLAMTDEPHPDTAPSSSSTTATNEATPRRPRRNPYHLMGSNRDALDLNASNFAALDFNAPNRAALEEEPIRCVARDLMTLLRVLSPPTTAGPAAGPRR
jgi:hypothetical protein